jgi:ectoine hydroxylase-related dioxygenase (phytanoyl-CoA dioxygenase family)
LTLQGGIAHGDVPIEAGPTFVLPNSQKYGPGYLASDLPEFRDYSERMAVQIPFAKGDAVFFNPALFHGAGENRTTDTHRLVNLLQVSSPFGRAMESVDRRRIVTSIYPSLLAFKAGGATDLLLRNAVAASAEGYAFPTDLDNNPPEGSHAPPAMSDVLLRALDEEWAVDKLLARL